VTGAPTINVKEWGVWGSNPDPCMNYAMSLPTELRDQFYHALSNQVIEFNHNLNFLFL